MFGSVKFVTLLVTVIVVAECISKSHEAATNTTVSDAVTVAGKVELKGFMDKLANNENFEEVLLRIARDDEPAAAAPKAGSVTFLPNIYLIGSILMALIYSVQILIN